MPACHAVLPCELSLPPARRLLYRRLGAKLVVGMPFKDIATSGEKGLWLYSGADAVCLHANLYSALPLR